MTVALPFNLPRQQLPQPTDRLSDGFLHALPAPVGLWTPSKLALAAADFTPLPQKHFGALSGGITTVPGGFGTLAQNWALNGSTGYASVLNAINPTNITVAVLVKFNTTGTQEVFTKDDGSANRSWALDAFAGGVNKARWYLKGGINGLVSGGTILAAGTWYLLVGTYDGATLKIYNNGQPGGSVANSSGIPATSTPILIGKRGDGLFTNGSIAFSAIWSSPLADAQISSLCSCLFTGKPFPLFAPQTTEMFAGSAAAVTSGLLLRRRRAAA